MYTANNIATYIILTYTANMQTVPELGQALAQRRKLLNLKQGQVAALSGLSQPLLSRLEKGQLSEFGARKLMTLLAVLGLELTFLEVGVAGTLDELRRERGGA
jgi:transcriptional regulator with XRE-family HTH domain